MHRCVYPKSLDTRLHTLVNESVPKKCILQCIYVRYTHTTNNIGYMLSSVISQVLCHSLPPLFTELLYVTMFLIYLVMHIGEILPFSCIIGIKSTVHFEGCDQFSMISVCREYRVSRLSVKCNTHWLYIGMWSWSLGSTADWIPKCSEDSYYYLNVSPDCLSQRVLIWLCYLFISWCLCRIHRLTIHIIRLNPHSLY